MPQPPDKPKPLKITEFVTQDVPRKDWAIEGVWPRGAKGILGAPPKNGKSTLAVELAVSLATGTPMFGDERFRCRERAAVTFVHQGENSIARIRKDFDLILQARGLGQMEPVESVPYRTVNEDRAASGLDPIDGPEGEFMHTSGERFMPAWGEGAPHPEPDLEVLVNPGMVLGFAGGAPHPAVIGHRRWLERYARKRDYLILDPIYMLAGVSTNDEAAVIDLLGWLSTVHDAGCAVIFTHQSSIKKQQADGGDAARVMGSTFIPAWYETAIFPRRNKDGVFSIHVDNLREMGEESRLVIAGLGVGQWFYAPSAQGATDAAGRAAPRSAEKAVRMEMMHQVLAEDPTVSDAKLAEMLGVTERSIRNYRAEMGGGS